LLGRHRHARGKVALIDDGTGGGNHFTHWFGDAMRKDRPSQDAEQ
jgi:hypothetical protein